MNPLMLVGAAVLAAGLLTLAVAALLRPPASHRHLTVAEVQARLAKEAARKQLVHVSARAGDAAAAGDSEEPSAEPLSEPHRRAE